MNLDEVEIVGPQGPQAVLDAGPDVFGALIVVMLDRPRNAAALGRKIVLGAAVRDKASDPLLAQAVVDGGVDEVDAGVQDGVEEILGVLVRNAAGADLHCAEAERRNLEAGSAEYALRELAHLKARSSLSQTA